MSILCLQLYFLYHFPLKSQQIYQSKEKKETCPCLQSNIRFNDSSIKMLILHPEEVLAKPDSFWASDSAYQLVKIWHRNINLPVPMEQWKGWMQALVNTPAEERAKNPQLVASESMMQQAEEFNKKAFPYLCTFLPKDCPNINTTVYFTTAIMASGFQMGKKIILYGANADKDNLLIHELFHQGFDSFRKDIHIGKSHQDSLINQIYSGLQNEGMATYVGYKGLKEFPHCRTDMLKDDYKMFENQEDVKVLLNKMNELFKKAFTLEEKALQDSLWQVGSIDRAYYVVGCYMAKVIDEKLGREILVGTITKEPVHFVRVYNSLVDESIRVIDLSMYRK
jgi:hypothetical protein